MSDNSFLLLAELKQKHIELDLMIRNIQSEPIVRAMVVKKLKKQKLSIKDQIKKIESDLNPDIIA